jgi:hypothetical protein
MKQEAQQLTIPATQHALNTRVKTDPDLDRTGESYKRLLALQADQLESLKYILVPKSFVLLQKHCERTNKPTDGQAWPKGRHEVLCGTALANWLLEHGRFKREQFEG